MKLQSLFISCLILGSSLSSPGQQFTFVKFGIDEGLRHSQVYDLAQDEYSNLWLATATSVIYRFDGQQFYPYKISVSDFSGSIYSYKIKVDRSNHIWILSNIGILRFDGKQWTRVTAEKKITWGFTTKWLMDKSDRIWIVAETGDVYLLKEDRLEKFPIAWPEEAGKITDLFEAQNNEIFFVTRSGVHARLGKADVVKFETWPWLVAAETIAVYHTPDEIIVSSPEIITVFSRKSGTADVIPLGELKDRQISRMLRDRDGLLWGMAQGDLICIDQNQHPLLLKKENGFINNAVFSILKDNNGVAWFCTDAEGILASKQQPVKKLALGRDTHVLAIAYGCDSTVVLGTYDQGLISYKKSLLKGSMVTCLLPVSAGEFYAGTMGYGLYRIQGSNVKKIPLSLEKANYIFCINKLGEKILFGSLFGLHALENGEIKNYNLKGLPLIVNAIATADPPDGPDPDDHRDHREDWVLVGSETYGLMKFDFNTFEPVGPDFLKESTVYTIQRDGEGNFFVGGDFSKILIYDRGLQLKYTLDLASALSNILFLEIMDENNLLVGSNDGVFSITHQRGVVKSIRKFGKTDGYEGEEVYLNSSMRLKKNSILFGTTGGAYKIEKESGKEFSSIPRTYLTGVLLSNQEADWEGRGDSLAGYFRIPRQMKLQHNENNVTFMFSGTSLGNPENINYQYQLEGLETNWSAVGTTKQVTYSNLAPGTYVFKVQSIGDNRLFGNIASSSFRVLPAFWQTAGFYVLMVVFFAGVVFLIIRFSVAFKLQKLRLAEEVRIGEQMKLRKQMSMDFHDEMGNKLASMLAQASLLKLKNMTGELNQVFDYFERTAYAIYQGTRDFIWSIDFKSNNLREVITYLRDFGFTHFEKNNVVLNVGENMDGDEFDKNLPEGHNRQIVLIFKEAMTNSMKHSMCKSAFLHATLQGGQCTLIFSDDGQWRETEAPGHGLRNMYDRASKIGAVLRIKKGEPRTDISLSFNLNQWKNEKT